MRWTGKLQLTSAADAFCFGVLLSFAAHWILVQVAGGIIAQVVVSLLGIILLVGIAWIATFYRGLPNLFGTETRVIRIGKDVPMIDGEKARMR
jgi:hypothetical protein